jgi:purine nucleosidase
LRHGLSHEDFDRWLQADSPRARFYAAISRRTRSWGRERGRTRLLSADALAMAVAIQPDLVVQSELHHVAVELAGHLTRGATVVDWEDRMGLPANARIVLKVDQARFEHSIRLGLGAA